MGIVYSALPRPQNNLSQTYQKSDYGGGSLTSYINVGPIIFLAPNKVQFYSYADYTASLAQGDRWFRCNIQINCQDGSKTISNNYVSDYGKPYAFSGELTTSTPITSITIPDRGIASFIEDSTGATSANPAISGDFERTIPVVQAVSPYIIVKSYKLTHILLPATPVEGQWFRIKCGINCSAYIHTLGIPIDNAVAAAATSFTTNSVNTNMTNMQNISGPHTAYGFTMNTLDSCMLVYIGSQWIVQEYRNGGPNIDYSPALGGGTIYTYWNTVPVIDTLPSSRYNLLASSPEVTICDMTNGSRSVQLPNPSTFVGIKYILAAPANPAYTLSIIAPKDLVTGKYMFEEANSNPYDTGIQWMSVYPGQFANIAAGNGIYGNCFTLGVASGNQIAITLFSDGTWWWILNTHIGQYTYINTANNINKVTLSDAVTCLNTNAYTGVILPAATGSQARYIKMLRTNIMPIYASCPANTTLAGSTYTNITLNNQYSNNTALSLIGYKKDNNVTEYYTVGSFIGY